MIASACLSEPNSDQPDAGLEAQNLISPPDGITLYAGLDCLEDIAGQAGSSPGQRIEFTHDERFHDDTAQSIRFTGLIAGTIIRLYDNVEGDMNDDWLEIVIKRAVESYCLTSLETSFEDSIVSATYSALDGLNGEVSLMTTDQTMVEIPNTNGSPTATFVPTFQVASTITPSITPYPDLPFLPEGECIPTGTQRESATVSSVIDGDTIEVLVDGVTFRVTYIGTDAPDRGQPYAMEATRQNADLIYGKTVTLVKDASHTDQDGNLLRYVVSGNVFVNYALIEQGFARASATPPDMACSAEFVDAQDDAVSSERGMWSVIPTPLPPTPTSASAANILITFIQFEGEISGDESDEFVQVTNQGVFAVNLEGWRLNAGELGQDFHFSALRLEPGLSCRIYTNEIHPEYCGLSFGSGQEVWDNESDCGYLYDENGIQVSKYCY